ncbi:MAG TPA: recombinase family protein [Candidatus Eisenbacteria bacterium]|nr:recombinase family protein [Candidatus Eisenbacteria bacterium]
MRVGVYARVSSEEQAERGSIRTQVDELRRWCAAEAIVGAVEFLDDGISGTVPFEERPGGAALLQAAREKKIDTVVVFKLDRIGRRTTVTLRAVEVLEALGVTIKAASEPFDTSTPAGRFSVAVMAGAAALEKENIVERTSAGLRRRMRETAWSGGTPPYGYRVESGRLVVDADEAETVSTIFSMVAAGTSSLAVAAHLDARGVATPSGQPKWSHATVRRVTRNEAYKGARRYEPKGRAGEVIEAACPAIVTVGLWEAAQRGRARNFKEAKRNRRREYLLSGLMRCRACSRAYSGTATSAGTRCYVCGGARTGCRAKRVYADEAEQAIWTDIECFLRNPGDALAELARRQATGTGAAFTAARIKNAKAKLARKGAERERVITLHRRGTITQAEVDAQLAALRQEQDALTVQIAALEDAAGAARHAEERLQGAASLLTELNRRLDAGPLDFDTRRKIVEALVPGIEVTTTGAGRARDVVVDATYYFSFPDDAVVAQSL